MAEYSYTATAVDSKNPSKSGSVTATSSEEAEKKVKALFTYPVTVSLGWVAMEPGQLTEKLKGDWGVTVAAQVAAAAPKPKE